MQQRGATGDPPGQGATVLVVDDFVALRQSMCIILRSRGYTVLSAASGVEALEMASRHAGPIDILLTDLRMPKVQGQELARTLLASRPGLKVIFMTGDVAAAGDPGQLPQGSLLLAKPFRMAQLMESITGLMAMNSDRSGT